MQAEAILKSDAVKHNDRHLSSLGLSSQETHGFQGAIGSQVNIGSKSALSDELKSAFLAIPAGIIFVNRFGVVELVNSSATCIFAEDVEGMLWRDIINKHFMPQKDDGLEVSLRNGRKIKFSISKLPNIPGQLIHLTDLTTTRVLQSKISHMGKLSSLGKMVASLAHQLRTPLSAAILYAMNLNSLNLNKATQARFSSKLVSRLKDLESQINDMLLFAKSGSSGVLESINIVQFLNETVAELIDSSEGTQARITFTSPVSHCQLNINSSAIKGAVNNLVQNAIELRAQQVNVSFSMDDNGCYITVADDGPGISKPMRDKIFEPFYTTRSQGTGLGLAVVAAVAKSHKGEVSVSNGVESGAIFQIKLPLCLRCSPSKDVSGSNNSLSIKHRLAGEIA